MMLRRVTILSLVTTISAAVVPHPCHAESQPATPPTKQERYLENFSKFDAIDDWYSQTMRGLELRWMPVAFPPERNSVAAIDLERIKFDGKIVESWLLRIFPAPQKLPDDQEGVFSSVLLKVDLDCSDFKMKVHTLIYRDSDGRQVRQSPGTDFWIDIPPEHYMEKIIENSCIVAGLGAPAEK